MKIFLCLEYTVVNEVSMRILCSNGEFSNGHDVVYTSAARIHYSYYYQEFLDCIG